MQKQMISICVRTPLLLMTYLCFTSARLIQFVQEPIDISFKRNYPVLETPLSKMSTIQCGVTCASSAFCAMFLHHITEGQCVLYGVTNTTTLAYTISSRTNWKSYVYKSDCQDLYVRALDACWKITDILDIMEASQTLCRNNKGSLIEFESMEELHFMRGALLSTPAWAGGQYWIGATKSSIGFIWQYGRKSMDSNMFAAGQPDGYGVDEYCVDALPIFSFFLNDVNCEQARSAICEISIHSLLN